MSNDGERGKPWLAERKARRADPANCYRCGRPKPVGAPRGQCEPCKAKRREWRARTAGLPIQTDKGTTVVLQRKHLAEVFQRLARLEARITTMQDYGRKHYRRGYVVGVNRGRSAPRQDEHDAWRDPIDFDDSAMMSHRMGSAGE